MNEETEDSEGTLVYRRSDFDDGQRGPFPEDLRKWKPALRLIQLIEQEVANLPSEAVPTPDARKLAAILLWCLATGRYGSWDIEALCEEEPLTRHIAAGLKPSHTDIHSFRRNHEGPILQGLTQILAQAQSGGGGDPAAEALRRYGQARYADSIPPV